MRKLIPVWITVVVLSLVIGEAAFARGAGGGKAPAPHPSSSGMDNGNGTFSTDRDFGLDRATDRMDEQGLEHQEATNNVTRRKPGDAQIPKPDSDYLKK